MKKAQIAAISLIANNSKGEAINLAVIKTTNGLSIVRNVKQLATDLGNSYRLIGVNEEFITSVKHPALQRAVSKLKGGTVEGNWTAFKKGEEYTVTENMSVITDPNHPEYGKVEVGETRVHTADGVVIDGFLSLAPSMSQAMIEESAEASATFQAQLMGLLDSGSSSSSSSDVEALPELDEAVNEALATKASPAKAVEQE